MSRARRTLAAILLGAAAAAQGQDASRTSGTGYRLRVFEPVEGASLSTTAVRVRLELVPRAGEDAPAKNATPTPRPQIDLFLDNAPAATLKEGESAVVLERVAPGTHTLLVTASDSSGAVVERKEVHFTVLPPDRD